MKKCFLQVFTCNLGILGVFQYILCSCVIFVDIEKSHFYFGHDDAQI